MIMKHKTHNMKQENKNEYHKRLKKLMDEYVHFVYKVTKKFPKEELFGVVSQFRRASLSVILNYIEGYARIGEKSNRSFLKISYGSLKESKYLFYFSLVEKFLSREDYEKGMKLADEIGAMLWGSIKNEK
jgi:four helix bundle protein